MQNAHDFLSTLALVLCAAGLAAVAFQRLRLPVVFGYLLAGLVVGPNLSVPLLADQATIRTLSELGVILLMYSLGLEFSIRRVIQLGATVGVAALAETSLIFGLGYGVAGLLGWTPTERLFTGALVAISSTTIIASVFREQRVQGKLREIVFGILIIEDLIAVLLIALLSTVSTGGEVTAIQIGVTGVRLATFLIVLIGVGLLVLPRFMRFVLSLDRREITVIAAIGICFAAALLALSFGYSVALGAFIAGSLVAESGYGKYVERLIEPVRDVFVAIFFVAVGMLIDPRALVLHWPAIIALVLVVVIGKFVAVSMGVFLSGNGLTTAVRSGMSMAQIGEFSFIIAGVGLSAGAIRPFLYPVAVAACAITTLSTPWLVRSANAVAHTLDRSMPHRLQTYAALYGSWIEGLRSAPPMGGDPLRVRRTIRLALVDLLMLAGLIIATAAEMGRLAVLMQGWFGWSEQVARLSVVALASVAALPFFLGLIRMTGQLATQLAERAIPKSGRKGLDRAAAPRTALISTLQFALLLAAAVPLLAILQPFVPRLPTMTLLSLVVVALGVAVWRSAGSLYGHAQAGAEVIVMALMQHDRAHGTPAQLEQTMEHLSTMLPGLGVPEAFRLLPGSPAIGKSLLELNLRSRTGATVLAITRTADGAQQALVPAGAERLRDDDVVVLAGTEDAVEAARRVLLGVAPEEEDA
ncbi:MAG: cation:proton antiporter [Gemmatimonadaceae bacterium]